MTENEKRFIPYLMTTSLREILNAYDDVGIVRLEGRKRIGENVNCIESPEVGLTIKEKSMKEAIIDWYGSAIWGNRLLSKIESQTTMHDMSIEKMRLRVKSDREIANLLEGEWEKKEGDLASSTIEISDMPKDDYIYLNFVSNKPDFDINERKVSENKKWAERWNEINKCDKCGEILCEHGFKHMLMEVTKLESKHLTETIPDKDMPKIKFDRSDIASWIHKKVIKSDLASPNGVKVMKQEPSEEWYINKL